MRFCNWHTVAIIAFALLGAAGCTERVLTTCRPASATAMGHQLVGTLVTENYEVTITMNRQEGEVTCEDVIYHGVSRKSGKSIALKGSTYHTHSPDGTPSRFLGYRFEEGDMQYVVLEDGLLQITRGDSEVLVEEEGVWRE